MWNFRFFFNSILLGIGLAMDALAVSICKGLSFSKIRFKNVIIVGLYFVLIKIMRI